MSTQGGRIDPARLEAFVRASGVAYKAKSKSFVFTCPRCNKPEKLWMRRDTGRFVCFVCAEDQGFRGAPEYALKELTGQPLLVVRKALYGDEVVPATTFLDLSWYTEVEEDDYDDAVVIASGLEATEWPIDVVTLDDPQGRKGAAYLAGRGIPPDVAQQYDIRYSPASSAVVFPVALAGQLYGWQYRTVLPLTYRRADGTSGTRLKTWSSDGIPRDRLVMFADRLAGSEHAVLCEGPVDALKAHLVGGNVATMGKAISEQQLQAVLRTGVRKLYLALDPDAASEIEPLLHKVGDVPTFLVELPEGAGAAKVDMGSLSFEEARDRVLAAKPLRRGRIHLYWNQHGLAD